ncbi:MAG TPA: DUF1802 family protein, partial [Humisphaera sp.]
MPLPASLPTALKEWKLVTDALAGGRQALLLRKGGIYESGGEFELEHRHFVFFPTYVHQNLRMLKPDEQAGFEARSAEPEKVTLAVAGEVTDIVQVQDRPQMDRLDAEHIWAPPLIDMRFSYRPENPLYIVLVRAYRLAAPVTVANTPAYAGCKSWVPLDQPIATAGATPALDNAAYAERVGRIKAA